VRSWWGLLAGPIAVLGGMSFGTCSYAYAAATDSDRGLTMLMRFVVTPMSLFAGTYFPVEQLPGWLQPVAWATPLWHAVDACRSLTAGAPTPGPVLGHVAYLAVWLVAGVVASERVLRRRLVS
jgi:lipooligosaccharide transport system permease protein